VEHRHFKAERQLDRRKWEVFPRKAVNADFTGKLPPIDVHSVNRLHLTPVLDEITNTWLATGDIKKAWLAGYKKADATSSVIPQGESLRSVCECPAQMPTTANHHCASCGKETSCNMLKMCRYGISSLSASTRFVRSTTNFCIWNETMKEEGYYCH
jgi:hypothetical protein